MSMAEILKEWEKKGTTRLQQRSRRIDLELERYKKYKDRTLLHNTYGSYGIREKQYKSSLNG